MPQTNRRFLLSKRPVGAVRRDDFTYEQVPVTEPAEGQVLVKNLYLSLDPAMRGWMNEGKSYIAPVALGHRLEAATRRRHDRRADVHLVAPRAPATTGREPQLALGEARDEGRLAAGRPHLLARPRGPRGDARDGAVGVRQGDGLGRARRLGIRPAWPLSLSACHGA